MRNRIDDAEAAAERDRLRDWLLNEFLQHGGRALGHHVDGVAGGLEHIIQSLA